MATVELCCKLKAEPLKLGTKHWSSTHAQAIGEGEENRNYQCARSATPVAHRTFLKLDFYCFVQWDLAWHYYLVSSSGTWRKETENHLTRRDWEREFGNAMIGTRRARPIHSFGYIFTICLLRIIFLVVLPGSGAAKRNETPPHTQHEW